MDGHAADILLIDETPGGTTTLEAALANTEPNIVKAPTAVKALGWLLENECALILLVWRGPGSDGLETATRIRQQERPRRTPIIFIADPMTDADLLSRVCSLGAVDCLFTPIVPAVIRAKIELLVGLWQFAREKDREAEELAAGCKELVEFVEAVRAGQIDTIIGAGTESKILHLLDARIVQENERLLGELARTNARLEADVAARKEVESAILRHDALLSAINSVLHEALSCDTDEAVAATCLAVAEVLTESAFGFVGELNHRGTIDMLALSHPDCIAHGGAQSGPGQLVKGLEPDACSWRDVILKGRAVIINDPSLHPGHFGVVTAEPVVTSMMAVPLRRKGATIGMIALANKEGRYEIADQEALETLSVAFTEALMRARAERELVFRNQELEEASRVKDEFLAKMSHELRTPLNSIIGFTEMMIHDAEDEPAGKRAKRLEKVHRNAQNLLALINDILDISKIEAGKVTLRRDSEDLRALITECIDLAAPLVKDASVELTSYLAGSLDRRPTWVGDAVRLRQIIMNLLGNAAKFTENGRIELRASLDEDWLVIKVSDTGPGVPTEHLTRIFDEFHQVDSSITRRTSGTGLGLSICRKLCRLMGGDVTVRSHVGAGSCFTVRIPVGEPAESPPMPHERSSLLYAGSPTTLRSVSLALQSIAQQVRAGTSQFTLPPIRFTAAVDQAAEYCHDYVPAVLCIDPFWDDALRVVMEAKTNQHSEHAAVVLLGTNNHRAAVVQFDNAIAWPLGKDTLHRILRVDSATTPVRVLLLIKRGGDNAFLPEMLAEFEDLTIVETASVQEGAALVADNWIDVVIVDPLDAQADGLELARVLEKNKRSDYRLLALIPRHPSPTDVDALKCSFASYIARYGEPLNTALLRLCTPFVSTGHPSCLEGVAT